MNRSTLWIIVTFIFCRNSIGYSQLQIVPSEMEKIYRLRAAIHKDLIIDMPDGSQISMSRCGFVNLENAEIDIEDIKQWKNIRTDRSDLSIPIAFHIIYASDETGYISESKVNEQVNVLNTSYAPWGISFILNSLDYTQNSDWFYNNDEEQYKSELAISPSETLNIYTTTAGGFLGYAYLPSDFDENSYMHGVVLNYETLPGVTNWQYDEGDTGVHEVGHYLGLLHTFGNFSNGEYGDCTVGDEVDDTPDQDGTEEENVYICDDNLNTCPDDGNDPVHNYMNYADDACLFEFTAGQENRMQFMLDTYRPSLGNIYGCTDLYACNYNPNAAVDDGSCEYGGENGSCCQLIGDMNGDAQWHVDDIVLLVNCILVEECDALDNGCAGDINGDEEWHVDDIVLLVNCILAETCFEDLDH